MIEIRFHGRGGQGAVVASKILACAFFMEGKQVQAFPQFGVERRGAPVQAFLRVSEAKIFVRHAVYAPDHLIVLDPNLIQQVDVTSGFKRAGWVIVNTAHAPGDFTPLAGLRVATVDASKIAVANRLGSAASPIVNTAILGAFARVTGLVGIESVMKAIRDDAPIRPEANARAAQEAFEQTVL
jgi:2-oxoacid:acceptor oxidoreductase gamma subunit (pyruvate/2-ketoisovalerate family)